MELDPLQFDPETRAAFDRAVADGREREFLFDLAERGYMAANPPIGVQAPKSTTASPAQMLTASEQEALRDLGKTADAYFRERFARTAKARTIT